MTESARTIEKIISGGQTGADLGGLVAARRLGIPTGGWAPKGYRTEKGPQPILADYGLVETEEADYTARTKRNILDADATLVFASNSRSAGTRQTLWLAQKHGKPVSGPINPFGAAAVDETLAFLRKHRPRILNVAGNRESRAPGITAQVAKVLVQAIRIATPS